MFYIKPKRAYCRKHGIEYSGYICPECRMEMERKSHSHSGTIPEVKHNDKVSKPKKKEINIENFPISDEVLEKASQLENKKPKPKSKKEKIKPPFIPNLGNLHNSEVTERQKSSKPSVTSKPPRSSKTSTLPFRIPNWLFVLLLIFALSILGLGFNALTKSPIPFWLLLGFSIIFPIEKWFRNITLNKPIGKLYRLILNLVLLATLGLLVWSGFQLVAKQLAATPLSSSAVFLVELVFFIWIWRKIAKNSWRWPSMKLTIFVLVCIAIVFTFAGVPPLSTYKDGLVIKWEEYQAERAAQQAEIEAEIVAGQQRQQAEIERAEAQRAEVVRQEQLRAEQARREAEEEAVRIASLRNPSWAELKAFLLADNTDKMEYVYPIVVCADFANKLQENAEKAGWRCAIVRLDMVGYTDPYNFGIASNAGHACNIFETTDRGLVYIDCTGLLSGGYKLTNCDKIVDVVIGKEYVPISIFPKAGWSAIWGGMGVVIGVDIRW